MTPAIEYRAPRLCHRALIVGLLACLITLALGGGVASASGWWHLGIGARPGFLRAGAARTETQLLTVSATGGFFVLEKEAGKTEAEKPLALFAYNASPQTVQTELEAMFGAGNVEVPEGEGDAAGDHPYKIVFKGELAGRPVPLIKAYSSFFGGLFALEGGRQEASVSEAARGRPDGEIVLTATNLGDAGIDGSSTPVQIADRLPAGMKAVSVEGLAGNVSVSPGAVSCVLEPAESPETPSCSFTGTLPPFDVIEVRIGVSLQEGAVSGDDRAVVSGGGVAEAAVQRQVPVSDAPVPFGVDDYEVATEEEGGKPAVQAGSHPFQLTTTLAFNQLVEGTPAGMPKDATFEWPEGLIGNPTAVPRCSLGQFLHFIGQETLNECSAQSAVGVAVVTIKEPANNLGTTGPYSFTVPVFNLEPAVGEPARFGFLLPGVPVYIDASVRTGGDYGVTINVSNISQTASVLRSEVTIWGVPGDARHDNVRGTGCLRHTLGQTPAPACNPSEDPRPPAFLELPTSCSESLRSTVSLDSWAEPHPAEPAHAESTFASLVGCNRLAFTPTIAVAPEGQAASTPTGLNVDVHVPQDEASNASGLGQSDVKSITVALPEEMNVNAASAAALMACSEAEIGYLPGASSPPSALRFTAGLPAPKGAPSEPFCPEAAKIGTVRIKTPLLPNPLEGSVYLAAQTENPFGSLLAMYIVAEDPVSGTLVKIAGEVKLTESGGLIATQSTPQVAFEDAEVHFFGGSPRAPLATPAQCGIKTTTASFAPWSGNPPVESQSRFAITSGPGGSACNRRFAPSLQVGTLDIQSGAFSALSSTIGREDQDEDVQTVRVSTPPGLSGVLTGVTLCGEAQADAGTCPAGSLIGHTTVSVGVGSEPFNVVGGEVFLTGGYGGAPFGLSIVNEAKAGPFDLGKVVVRARIDIDPHTAALTVTTDGSGPYAIPSVIKGIPLHIKRVNVTIDRPDFTFNPTNCSPLTITATITSVGNAAAKTSSPFEVANCATLKFKPSFSVSTSGKTSRANGASLHVKLTYPNAPFGSQANIKSVHVELPRALPSRLSTLNHACAAAVFAQTPANCPSQSKVGFARAVTPVIPVPLEGPAYFVSHGGEEFPDLIMVLQGYGVTVDLVGSTFIKNGTTSSTFKTVPDVPVGSFELTLPEGPFSALAANRDLCQAGLVMPTTFDAQNGAVFKQSTLVAVSGCPYRLAVLGRRVRGRTLTLSVSVPAAGRLVASGNGLSSAAKSASGRQTLVLKLSERRAGRLRTKVALRFTSGTGGKRRVLHKSLTVAFG